MNKAEATKTLADFIEFNKQDISNMTVDYPELGGIFGDLLVAIDKEYASGTINKADLVVAEETKAIREPQEGDWYKSKSGNTFQFVQLSPNDWGELYPKTGQINAVTIEAAKSYIRDGSWELTEYKAEEIANGFKVGDVVEVVRVGGIYSGMTARVNKATISASTKSPKAGAKLFVVGDAAKYFMLGKPNTPTLQLSSLDATSLGVNYVFAENAVKLTTAPSSNPTITTDRDAQDLVGYTLVDKQNKFQFLEVKKGKRFAYSAKLINLTTKNTFNWSLGQATVNKLLSGGTTVSKQYIEELQGGANLPRKAAPTPPSIAKGMPDYNNMNNLVGLTLLFTVSGKQYKVNKLIKNNPKNIIYEIQNLANNIITDHPIPRNTVQRLLRAEDNMNIKVVELQAIKAAAQTTTSVAPVQASNGSVVTYLSDWRPTWKGNFQRASPQRSTKTKGELGMGYDGIVYERMPNVKGVYQWKKTGVNSIAAETLDVFKKEDLQVLSDQLTYALTLFSKGDSEYDETQRQITRVAQELNKR
jgi:hypothetical protein